jgi:hypothetical protein
MQDASILHMTRDLCQVGVAFLKPVFHAVCVRARKRVYIYKRKYIQIYTYIVCVCDVCVYGREWWIC